MFGRANTGRSSSRGPPKRSKITMNRADGSFTLHGTVFHLKGKYEPLRALGKGAYGFVCAAKRRRDNKKVAIKRVSPMAQTDVDARHTLREIRLMRFLGRHENIISLEDVIVDIANDELYLIMDLMDTDLHRVIQSPQPLTDAHYKHFMYQLLRGVAFAHRNGVIHRDLKPGNLLVTKDCDLVITDFGLSRMKPEETDAAMTEHVVTRWYRPPELMLSADGSYDESVDIWSIGCIFAEMLGRTPLFPGKNFIQQLCLIFDVIGSPPVEELAYIKSEQALRFMHSLPRKPRVNFTSLYPAASPKAIDLLENMLVFLPRKRITVEQALQHPYFDSVRSQYSPIDPQLPPEFEFEFEKDKALTAAALKRMIVSEAEALRRERRREAANLDPKSIESSSVSSVASSKSSARSSGPSTAGAGDVKASQYGAGAGGGGGEFKKAEGKASEDRKSKSPERGALAGSAAASGASAPFQNPFMPSRPLQPSELPKQEENRRTHHPSSPAERKEERRASPDVSPYSYHYAGGGTYLEQHSRSSSTHSLHKQLEGSRGEREEPVAAGAVAMLSAMLQEKQSVRQRSPEQPAMNTARSTGEERKAAAAISPRRRSGYTAASTAANGSTKDIGAPPAVEGLAITGRRPSNISNASNPGTARAQTTAGPPGSSAHDLGATAASKAEDNGTRRSQSPDGNGLRTHSTHSTTSQGSQAEAKAAAHHVTVPRPFSFATDRRIRGPVRATAPAPEAVGAPAPNVPPAGARSRAVARNADKTVRGQSLNRPKKKATIPQSPQFSMMSWQKRGQRGTTSTAGGGSGASDGAGKTTAVQEGRRGRKLEKKSSGMMRSRSAANTRGLRQTVLY